MDYIIPIVTIVGSICVAWGVSQQTTKNHSREIGRLRDRDEKQIEQITRLETKVDNIVDSQVKFQALLENIEKEIFKIK